MWCFKAFMAIRDYAIARPGMRERVPRKTRVQSQQKPDMTQHNSGQRLVVTISHDPNNFAITK